MMCRRKRNNNTNPIINEKIISYQLFIVAAAAAVAMTTVNAFTVGRSSLNSFKHHSHDNMSSLSISNKGHSSTRTTTAHHHGDGNNVEKSHAIPLHQKIFTGDNPAIVTLKHQSKQPWWSPQKKKITNNNNNNQSITTNILVNEQASNNKKENNQTKLKPKKWHTRDNSMTLSLIQDISVSKPGYLNMVSTKVSTPTSFMKHRQKEKFNWALNAEPKDNIKYQGPTTQEKLWVTGFSVTSPKGVLKSVDIQSGKINSASHKTESKTVWPNEVNTVPSQVLCGNDDDDDEAVLISDGFLVPGKDKGGVYIVRNPGKENEQTLSLVDEASEGNKNWFYHRSIWIDLTGDGRKSILTARAKPPKLFGKKDDNQGELVWLEMPKPHHVDPITGKKYEEDGSPFDPLNERHLPWKTRVLAQGPDVMFNVADLNPNDDTIEIIASQFFGQKVSLHSIQKCDEPKVCFERVIDDKCGHAFGSILADLDCNKSLSCSGPKVVDSGSTVETLKPGDDFSHILISSHESSFMNKFKNNINKSTTLVQESDKGNQHSIIMNGNDDSNTDGGSVFSYRVPQGSTKDAWKTEPWIRSTVATGFKVDCQFWNMINPGAPGFVYTFHARKGDEFIAEKRPMIAVAGDCAESAYIFRPSSSSPSSSLVDDQTTTKKKKNNNYNNNKDSSASYELMAEIKCGATVGSIGIGYEHNLEDENRLCSIICSLL